MFSGGKERDQWHEMGQLHAKQQKTNQLRKPLVKKPFADGEPNSTSTKNKNSNNKIMLLNFAFK